MAGMKVIPVKTLSDGSLDLADLKEKAEKYKETLAAFMVGSFLKTWQNVRRVLMQVPSRSRIPARLEFSKPACRRLARSYTITADRFTLMVCSPVRRERLADSSDIRSSSSPRGEP